jgi:hypothetical protein
MARYSVRTGRWYGRGRDYPPRPLPPPDDRQWRTELPGGLVRIDMGEPVRGLACEPQPARIGIATPVRDSFPEPAHSPAAPDPSVPIRRPASRPRDWRHDYGLAKRR